MLHCAILFWIGIKLDMPTIYYLMCVVYCAVKIYVDCVNLNK